MYILWFIIVLFISLLLEVGFGNAGYSFPFILLAGYYYSTVASIKVTVIPLLITAVMMENLRVNQFPIYITGMFLVLIMGELSKRFGDPGSVVFRFAAGWMIGLCWLLLQLLDALCQKAVIGVNLWGYVLAQLFLPAILFCALQLFLDGQAQFLHFRTWAESSRQRDGSLDKELGE